MINRLFQSQCQLNHWYDGLQKIILKLVSWCHKTWLSFSLIFFFIIKIYLSLSKWFDGKNNKWQWKRLPAYKRIQFYSIVQFCIRCVLKKYKWIKVFDSLFKPEINQKKKMLQIIIDEQIDYYYDWDVKLSKLIKQSIKLLPP